MHPPGSIRDAIIEFLRSKGDAASAEEIHSAVTAKLGPIGSSSVRSYLRLNTPGKFERTKHGHYRLKKGI